MFWYRIVGINRLGLFEQVDVLAGCLPNALALAKPSVVEWHSITKLERSSKISK